MMVEECMTRIVETIGPDETIREASRRMEVSDCGIMPVAEEGRLIGMISDRDIAIRAIGCGLGPETKVSEVMSAEVQYCFQESSAEDVIANMGQIQVRRLPVVNSEKQLVGIVSLSDFAPTSTAESGMALSEIARSSASHSQSI